MAVVRPGCEISREGRARHVARHRHIGAYAAIVLRGSYVEAGDSGRFRAVAGDVLLHDCFDAHQDCFDRSGADILNLPLAEAPPVRFGRIGDPDQVARLTENDARAAGDALLEQLQARLANCDDWPDRLASDIREERVGNFAQWAEECGVLPASLSRGFRLAYGVSPQRYRMEQRGARAARALRRSQASLSEIALTCGFSDQAHMTRTLGALYEASPVLLRASYAQCVQDRTG